MRVQCINSNNYKQNLAQKQSFQMNVHTVIPNPCGTDVCPAVLKYVGELFENLAVSKGLVKAEDKLCLANEYLGDKLDLTLIDKTTTAGKKLLNIVNVESCISTDDMSAIREEAKNTANELSEISPIEIKINKSDVDDYCPKKSPFALLELIRSI